MKITETKIKVSDLVENYKDNGDGGAFGYNDRLTIRPSFQREFIYGEKQRAAVIDSVMNGFPLNVMYWSKTGAETYEVLDGQQRLTSIYIGLKGSYAYRLKYKQKKSENAYPVRYLYLNLIDDAQDETNKYVEVQEHYGGCLYGIRRTEV